MSGNAERRSWWRFAVACVPLLLLAVVVWRQAGEPSVARNDFTQPVFFGAGSDSVYEGDGWSVELGMFDVAEGSGNGSGDQCIRFRVADMATPCVSVEQLDTGPLSGMTEGQGLRIVWVLVGSDEPVTIRRWSDRHERRDLATTTIVDGVQLAAFELADEEHPWGLQVLDADGHLVQVFPSVG